MTPGDSNGEGGEARPFRAESITAEEVTARMRYAARCIHALAR